jgi:uncharacterized protein YcbX
MDVGRVVSLHRYPLKSVGGEALGAADVTARGLTHDRRWGVYLDDGGIGSGKTTRRFRKVDGLLDLSSRVVDGALVVVLPDGEELAGSDPATDSRLSDLLGRAVTVREETTVPHHDECPVHVVTTASVRAWGDLAGEVADPRRARANVLVAVDDDGFVEDAWQGRRLRVGDVELTIGAGMPRCVMVNAAQPGLPRDGRFLKALGAREVRLGAMADVVTPGTVAVGDTVARRD